MTLSRKTRARTLAGVVVMSVLGGNILAAQAGDEAMRASGPVTAEDRQACTPDVMHLCRAFIPSRSAITKCLHDQIERVSPACRSVMASHR